ncbi:MAG: energy-coupling factor ABC transporter substrate-binding protein [Peptococcaceae bacterium]
MNLASKNILLLSIVIILAVLPLLTVHNSEFGGADGAAEEAILEIAPDYQPWFASFWEPPGGETESLLFALQAALGAGFIGYYIGLKKGSMKKNGQG